MLGDEVEAVQRFREGADTALERPLAVANCLAHLAVVDVEHGRWTEATAAARRARALLGDAHAFTSAVLVLAVNVLVETHAGRGADMDTDREICRSHLAGLLGIAPWLNLQARVVLARAALIRGDRADADSLLAEVDAILETVPDAAGVEQQVGAIRRLVPARDTSSGYGPSSLTTAELRVLRLLPTHLSVREIADRLYVSRNTVKSQTIAIYRKLGTSSRRGAIEVAVLAGLLADAVPPP
jgi:LuxR family maltose regulon positive regulatory protein